ncbi:MAG TPA: YccF domain-containing protein [Caulobacteraceae bacterium]|jgi:uncharacterized membrane protein YccF (DUF307 family)
MLNLILNVLWFVFGGFAAGLAWLVGGALMAVSLIGLPWAPAVFRIALFSFAPFGRSAAPTTDLGAPGRGCRDGLLNIVWFVLAGWWIALGHLIIALGQALTIIGIPFAVQHLKLAALALGPVGMRLKP